MKPFSFSFVFKTMVAICGCAILSGCASQDVYDEPDSWLVRENGRPHYFAAYDIFYLAPHRYDGHGEFPYAAYAQVRHEVVMPFGVHTRVFAPIYRDAEDVERALDYYLERYHDGDERPFVFLGEGDGAKILADLAREREGSLRKKGFQGGWYSPDTECGFVTEATVSDVNDFVGSVLYERSWGRRE